MSVSIGLHLRIAKDEKGHQTSEFQVQTPPQLTTFSIAL